MPRNSATTPADAAPHFSLQAPIDALRFSPTAPYVAKSPYHDMHRIAHHDPVLRRSHA